MTEYSSPVLTKDVWDYIYEVVFSHPYYTIDDKARMVCQASGYIDEDDTEDLAHISNRVHAVDVAKTTTTEVLCGHHSYNALPWLCKMVLDAVRMQSSKVDSPEHENPSKALAVDRKAFEDFFAMVREKSGLYPKRDDEDYVERLRGNPPLTDEQWDELVRGESI